MPPQKTIALIGGIGCGKSSVAALLAERGAVVVDADDVARAVVEEGSPVLEQLVASFGAGILRPDGTLDRAELARIAFTSPERTAALNATVHPAIGVELARRVAAAREAADVVVVAIPLYRPEHRDALGIDLVVCVDCDATTARERLVSARAMSADDADARIAAQPSREERLAEADEVLENTGTPEDLARSVEALWDRLVA